MVVASPNLTPAAAARVEAGIAVGWARPSSYL